LPYFLVLDDEAVITHARLDVDQGLKFNALFGGIPVSAQETILLASLAFSFLIWFLVVAVNLEESLSDARSSRKVIPNPTNAAARPFHRLLRQLEERMNSLLYFILWQIGISQAIIAPVKRPVPKG
jgi:hypothetical protein